MKFLYVPAVPMISTMRGDPILQVMEKSMTPRQIEEGRKLVREWQEHPIIMKKDIHRYRKIIQELDIRK